MTKKINKMAAMALGMAMFTSPSMAGDINVGWNWAGTAIIDVEMLDPASGETRVAALLHFKAKGSPGAAEVRVLSQFAGPPSPTCLGGAGLLFVFAANDTVATFNDLSQLFLVQDSGTACLDPHTGAFEEVDIEYNVVGGTGRFEGASGALSLSGIVAPATGLLFRAAAEASGTIHTP